MLARARTMYWAALGGETEVFPVSGGEFETDIVMPPLPEDYELVTEDNIRDHYDEYELMYLDFNEREWRNHEDDEMDLYDISTVYAHVKAEELEEDEDDEDEDEEACGSEFIPPLFVKGMKKLGDPNNWITGETGSEDGDGGVQEVLIWTGDEDPAELANSLLHMMSLYILSAAGLSNDMAKTVNEKMEAYEDELKHLRFMLRPIRG